MAFPFKDLPNCTQLREMVGKYSPGTEPADAELAISIFKFALEFLRAVDEHLGEFGFSTARFGALMLLLKSGENGLKATELAESMWVTRGNMTGILDGLESQGLILRQDHREDRRVIQIKITQKGRKHIEKMLPIHYKRMAFLASRVSSKEKSLLEGVLKKLTLNLHQLKSISP